MHTAFELVRPVCTIKMHVTYLLTVNHLLACCTLERRGWRAPTVAGALVERQVIDGYVTKGRCPECAFNQKLSESREVMKEATFKMQKGKVCAIFQQ